MKKAFLVLICMTTMMAANVGLKAQEIEITLYPGWNWISYPRADTLDLTTAMGAFTPLNGDVIKSRHGFVEYYNNDWIGNFQYFYPGSGYKYKSNRTEPVVLTFQLQEFVSQVVVGTSEAMNITATSAAVVGTVTIEEGNHVFIRGVCWDTVQMPTVDDTHITNMEGSGSFTATLIGLTQNTTYYVRAYVITDYGLTYGNQQSFTTETSNGSISFVDLDLPSGLLWATCNVGADTPEDYGDYFAFGETQTKDCFYWSNYQHCNGIYNTLTKYCPNSNFGYNGYFDNLTILQPEDDVVTIQWGIGYRMPTKEEWRELFQNTTQTWITQNGVNGMQFTGPNGNSIFLPASGCFQGTTIYGIGNYGNYWSSSINTDTPYYAGYFFSGSSGHNLNYNQRYYGQTIRPVCSIR